MFLYFFLFFIFLVASVSRPNSEQVSSNCLEGVISRGWFRVVTEAQLQDSFLCHTLNLFRTWKGVCKSEHRQGWCSISEKVWLQFSAALFRACQPVARVRVLSRGWWWWWLGLPPIPCLLLLWLNVNIFWFGIAFGTYGLIAPWEMEVIWQVFDSRSISPFALQLVLGARTCVSDVTGSLC